MAAINSSVLASTYAISAASSSQLNGKVVTSVVASTGHNKIIKAEAIIPTKPKQVSQGRRDSLLLLAATLFTSSLSPSNANAGIIEDYLEKSKANKELNDKKRLATSGANFARAFTVEFGSCKFPENFTGCQDLAKQKKVPFLSEDLELECEGKDKYKCGSNVFWKW